MRRPRARRAARSRVKSCSAQATRSGRSAAAGRASRARASGRPRSAVSNLLQRVTQWMSWTLLDARQRVELLPVELDLLLDLAEDAERPGREVDVRDAARVQHGPFLGHVLAGRQPGRVEARPRAPCAPSLDRNTGSLRLDRWVQSRPRRTSARAPTSASRARTRPTCSSGSSRTTCLAPATLRGADPDAEGPRDRAAPRLAPRRRRLPAADRARARRGRACPSDADAHRLRSARSSSRSTPRRSCSAAADGIPTADYGVPAVEVLDGDLGAQPADDELERLRILARHAALGPRARRGDPAGRGRASTSAPSRSRRAATRARSRSRACHTAATSTARSACSSSTARPRAQADEVGHGGRVGRPRHERRPGPGARLRPRRGSRGRRARRGGPPRADTLTLLAPVAQGIERCPAEAEAASSNLAGRMAQPGRSRRPDARNRQLFVLRTPPVGETKTPSRTAREREAKAWCDSRTPARTGASCASGGPAPMLQVIARRRPRPRAAAGRCTAFTGLAHPYHRLARAPLPRPRLLRRDCGLPDESATTPRPSPASPRRTRGVSANREGPAAGEPGDPFAARSGWLGSGVAPRVGSETPAFHAWVNPALCAKYDEFPRLEGAEQRVS